MTRLPGAEEIPVPGDILSLKRSEVLGDKGRYTNFEVV